MSKNVLSFVINKVVHHVLIFRCFIPGHLCTYQLTSEIKRDLYAAGAFLLWVFCTRAMLDIRKLTFRSYVKADVGFVNWARISSWGPHRLKSGGRREFYGRLSRPT